MERVKKIAAKVWQVFCTSVCSRVFAALLMCAVTLSMVMGVSSRMRVYTVNEGDTSRVMITLSDTPYLTLEGHDVLWVDTSVEEEEEVEDTTLSVEIAADGLSTLLQVTEPDVTVSDVIEQAGVTVGKLDRVSAELDAPVTDGMLVQVDRVAYEEYTVTETISYKTTYRYSCVLKPGQTKVDISGRNGEKVITYRKSIVNGEVVSTDKVDEEVTKKARNKVILKGSDYGTPISKTPSGTTIKLDSKNQPTSYSRVIYGSCTAYHGDTATSTGRKPGVGVVAVDPREIPYGSILWIVSKDGSFVYGYAIAGDTGGFIHNSETVVDLYMDSVVEMNTFGRRNLNVYVIKEGKGK
ncbi:MAG: G5 domain-containing protein [Clostridia bacterium]|nr:G5 domain-containing protein [Clostridia bacterium]